VGGTVQQARFNNGKYHVIMGPEAKVVGSAFALQANKISAPIEGNSGVYVVKNVSTVKAPVLKATLLM
jgi:peptidyl-prolyl cis-trans isomerase D